MPHVDALSILGFGAIRGHKLYPELPNAQAGSTTRKDSIRAGCSTQEVRVVLQAVRGAVCRPPGEG